MVHRQLLNHLGQSNLQNAVLKLSGDILGFHMIAHIEAAAALARIALTAQITAVLFLLILVQALGRADRQTTILQFQLDLILLKARQIHIQLIGILSLPHIGLHQILAVLTIERVVIGKNRHPVKGVLEKLIKQILTKNAR